MRSKDTQIDQMISQKIKAGDHFSLFIHVYKFILTHCPMGAAAIILISNGSGNGLVLSGKQILFNL